MINFIFTAAQSLDELAGDATKKVFDDGFSEIKARAAFKPAKLAEPAPHLTYNANDLENFATYVLGRGLVCFCCFSISVPIGIFFIVGIPCQKISSTFKSFKHTLWTCSLVSVGQE